VDLEIFKLLRDQAIVVCTFLLVTRKFASIYDMQNDVEKIDHALTENQYVLILANSQLSELTNLPTQNRKGLFDTI
jgi:hypothetical protein